MTKELACLFVAFIQLYSKISFKLLLNLSLWERYIRLFLISRGLPNDYNRTTCRKLLNVELIIILAICGKNPAFYNF